MSERQRCVDCGKMSPETDTNYTLISPAHGWRVSRRRSPAGTYIVDWRCPDCWRAYKLTARAGDEIASVSPSQPPPPRMTPPPRSAARPPSAPAPVPEPPGTRSSKPAPSSGRGPSR